MNALLNSVLDAHGGMKRWNDLSDLVGNTDVGRIALGPSGRSAHSAYISIVFVAQTPARNHVFGCGEGRMLFQPQKCRSCLQERRHDI